MYVLVLYLGLNLPAILIGDFQSKTSCMKFAEDKVAVINVETSVKGVCLKKEEV